MGGNGGKQGSKLAVPLIMGVLLGFASLAAAQTTYYVDCGCVNDGDGTAVGCAAAPGGVGARNEIQDAIDTTASAGDTILVADGVCTQNINFGGKEVVLKSIGGAANCIIDGAAAANVFFFDSGEGSGAVVEGFTVRNGRTNDGGGGFHLNSDTTPTIKNCIVRDNWAQWGGGIYLKHSAVSSPLIENCWILSNTAGQDGGGVYTDDKTSPVFRDCVIRNNNGGSSRDGAGIYINGSSNPYFIDTDIISNHASRDGGGVYCNGTSFVTFDNCVFQSNISDENGGGAYTNGQSAPLFTNCLFVGNSVTSTGANRGLGGAIHCNNSSSSRLYNCTLVNNSASRYGGGIFAKPSGVGGQLSVVNSIIWGNSAVLGGDQIQYDGGTFSVKYSDVQGGYGAPADNNIDADPLFVDGGDYHLTGSSPCIDSGTSDTGLYPQLPDHDIDDDPRPFGPVHDIGFDEAYCPTTIFYHDNDGDLYGDPTDTMAACALPPGYVSDDTDCDDGDINVNPGATEICGDLIDNDCDGEVDEADVCPPCIVYVDDDAAAPLNPQCADRTGETGDPFCTIQDAIDAIFNGCEAIVRDGFYPENIDFLGKAIYVHSVNGPTVTIIDGGASASTVSFISGESAISILEGFTVQKGSAAYGAGIECDWSSPTINGCVIKNNTGSFGGGVSFNWSNATVTGCVIESNTSANLGGGVYGENNSDPVLTDCIIRNNGAVNDGGGVYFQNSTTEPSLVNCVIDGNSSIRGAGMMAINSAQPDLTNCAIVNNTASTDGGGLNCSLLSNVDVVNTIVWGNSAASGAAAYVNNSALTIGYSDFNPALVTGAWLGGNNINAVPLFKAGSNYLLQDTSPCIDRGSNDSGAYPDLPAQDIEGQNRYFGAFYDIGVDEVYCAGTTYYSDNDGDLFGGGGVTACIQPPGYVTNNTDCDDNDPNTYPGAPELCDGVNNDCDAVTPDGSGEAWYGTDCDGGDSDQCEEGTYECSAGAQYCNDTTGDKVEICDGQDNDCNGVADDGVVDDIAPSSVGNLRSPSHKNAIGQYNNPQSSETLVRAAWNEATDNLGCGGGVDGYSVVWDELEDTVPDDTVDVAAGSALSSSCDKCWVPSPCPPGECWDVGGSDYRDTNSLYFHIKTIDLSGNSSDTEHIGPFFIDTYHGELPSMDFVDP